MKALMLLALAGLSISTAQAAEPTTLALACQGITTWGGTPDKADPVSLGIILNFTSRMVIPGSINYPVKITAVNEVTVAFSGSQNYGPSSLVSISGSVDRVTGDVEATSMITDSKTSKIITSTVYALKCKPTQRMF